MNLAADTHKFYLKLKKMLPPEDVEPPRFSVHNLDSVPRYVSVLVFFLSLFITRSPPLVRNLTDLTLFQRGEVGEDSSAPPNKQVTPPTT